MKSTSALRGLEYRRFQKDVVSCGAVSARQPLVPADIPLL
ncbi:hypothetical protein RTCIAT899_PB00530 (plasmid) [Rhizobium tropici CIAT 899]|nr:hypothetical protein RTCIAT899_PB00530 [Rhizobium tropici CIAT 899]